MDIILKAIKCHQCQKVLATPIILPCGHSICKQHADEAYKSVQCPKCAMSHQNQGFAINTELLEMINSQIGSMDFGPCHKEAKEACDKLEDIIGHIDHIIEDPIYYCHEVVDKLKNKVLLKREQLKLEIDESTEKMLTNLNEYQIKCEVNFNKSIYESNLDELKKNRKIRSQNLPNFFELLNQFKVDDETWKFIISECEYDIDALSKDLESLQKMILMDEYKEKKAHIDFLLDININQNFLWEILKSSAILDRNQFIRLRDLCQISSRTKWTLLWRGSRDGFGAEDFHSRCNNKPKTLTIVKTSKGYIFGGYAEQIWDQLSGYCYRKDPNAYIFSLVNNITDPFVIKTQQPLCAIRIDPSYGPTFGIGHDIHICDNSNKSTSSYSYLYSYLPENLEMDPHILAGTKNFQVKEIEVFQLE